MSKNVIEIEITANKIYYTIIGKKEKLEKFIKNNNKYIIAKIIIPLALTTEKYFTNNKNIIPDLESEKIQCSILCDCSMMEIKELYMILEINKIRNIKFPELAELDGVNNEPEILIAHDIKKISETSNCELDNYILDNIMRTIKIVDIIGENSDVLVYLVRL